MKTIIVTGATGFIGLEVVKTLVNNNYFVIALTRDCSDILKLRLFKNVSIVNIDYNLIEDIFRDYTVEGIIHLATYYKAKHEQKDIDAIIQSNVIFPTELLNMAIKYDIKWFINTGSGSEYKNNSQMLNEKTEICPKSLYAHSKVTFDLYAKFILFSTPISYINMIIFTPYGVGDKSEKLIPSIINSYLNNVTMHISNQDKKLNFTYVTDIAESYLKALQFIEKNSTRIVERFNIGSYETYSIRSAVTLIKDITKLSSNVSYINTNFHTENYIPNNSKITSLLEWKPVVNFTEGLKKVLNYEK